MSDNGIGYVYILKDDHFKRGVKIGRAQDVSKRMRSLVTANPWLSVYVKIRTRKWIELEKATHNIIKLVAKTKQVKNSEFYLIEPEKAKKIMLEFARLLDKDDFKISTGDGTEINVATAIPRQRMLTRCGVQRQFDECGWKNVTQFAKWVARKGGNEGAFGGLLHFLSRRKPCTVKSKWRKPLEKIGVKFDSQDFVLEWKCAKKAV